MGKRRLRLEGEESINAGFAKIIGKKVNIVFNNSAVVLALVLKLDNGILHYRNMRNAKMKAALNKIAEIIIDY